MYIFVNREILALENRLFVAERNQIKMLVLYLQDARFDDWRFCLVVVWRLVALARLCVFGWVLVLDTAGELPV